jgi:hypothetical protein
MASEQLFEERRKILRDRGVPEKFVEAIATRNDLGLLDVLRILPLTLVLLAGFLVLDAGIVWHLP